MNMKQIIIKVFMSFCLFTSMNVFAQQTSLTVDNQTPGWLSSKIGYEDQLTVQRLRVTGYLNIEDVEFLKKLSTQKKLISLDIEETHMVPGGSSEGYYSSYIEEDDVCESNVYKDFVLQKMIASKYASVNMLDCYKVDTFVVTHPNKNTSIDFFPKRMLWLAEGLEGFLCTRGIIESSISIPSTIRNIYGYSIYSKSDKRINIISFHMDPENIAFQITNSSNSNLMKGDTLWIPIGTKEKYLKTPFKNMKVILEMVPPEKVELDCNKLKLFKEESTSLQVSLSPQDVYFKELAWETSDSTIVTVSQSGEVKAVSAGTAIVTVYSTKAPEVKAQCEVTVYEHAIGIEMATEEKVNVGGTTALVANTLPLGTSDNEVAWSSDNMAIATVDEMGNVTGIKVGNCVITATSVDGGYSAECKITVVQPAKAVTLNKHETSIVVNNSETLKTTVNPENTTDKTVIWSTSNADIAEVSDNGLVTAKKAGKVFVTATAVSNLEVKDSCEVTVIQPVEGITLDKTSIIIEEFGEMVKLNATIQPEDASNKSISWSSSNPAVCTVSANGTVIAVGNGTATVIATTVDGGIPATCVVNVKDYFCDTNRDGVVDVADIAVIIDKMAGRARLLNEKEK